MCLLCSLEVGICIAVQVCMIQIPILVLFNAFFVRLLKHFDIYVVTISFCPKVSVLDRMWALCCYSVTCTSGPASSVLFWSTTSLWMASLITFRVSLQMFNAVVMYN